MKQRIRHALMHSPLADRPVRARGGLLRGARWTLFPYSMYWRGAGASELELAIAAHASGPEVVAWDVGAHFGLVAVAIALRGALRVDAFEPGAFAYAKLCRHKQLNGLQNLRTWNVAVSREPGTIPFVDDASSSTSYVPDAGQAAGQTVPCVQLDALVARGELTAPNFVKIDIEGHGSAALEGAQATIERHRPVLLLAWHTLEEVVVARRLLEDRYDLLDLAGRPVEWRAPGDDSLLVPR